jgi:hypothetical protein
LKAHALALDFAADAINTAGALLNYRRIPTQVMVNYMSALTMKVDSFLLRSH